MKRGSPFGPELGSPRSGQSTRLARSFGRVFHRRSVYGDEPVDRLVDEMRSIVAIMRDSFERESLEEEIERLQLYCEDDDSAARSFDPQRAVIAV